MKARRLEIVVILLLLLLTILCGYLVSSSREVKLLVVAGGTGWTVVVVVAFSSPVNIFGQCSTISIPLLRFFSSSSFEVEISSSKLIPPFMPGSVHSGSAS